jgi:hypothetical protein
VSGLTLPPSPPPEESVASLLERLNAAREQLREAERQEHMLDVSVRDHGPLTIVSAQYFQIERRVARNRAVLWTRRVRDLERRGRALGLEL